MRALVVFNSKGGAADNSDWPALYNECLDWIKAQDTTVLDDGEVCFFVAGIGPQPAIGSQPAAGAKVRMWICQRKNGAFSTMSLVAGLAGDKKTPVFSNGVVLNKPTDGTSIDIGTNGQGRAIAHQAISLMPIALSGDLFTWV